MNHAAGRHLRRIGLAAALVLPVAALLLAMRLLAAVVVAHEMGREAGQAWAALRAGDPPWRWPLREPDDVVAGRAFGAATLHRDGEALAVHSRDGSPFELGLPLARPADARHWPRLYLHADSEITGTLELLASRDDGAPEARHAGQAPVCRSEPQRLPASGHAIELDLQKLRWQADDGSGSACPAPALLDYLFRLRIRMPTGATLKLYSAELRATTPPPLQAMGDTLALPAPRRQALAALAAFSATRSWPAVPLLRLPPAGSVSAEDLLILRDAARLDAPGALFLSEGAALTGRPPGMSSAWIDWALCTAYALALLVLARRSPGRRPPWLDLAAILAGPLWLIAGLHLGRPGATPMYAAFAMGLLYAWRTQGAANTRGWHWLGRNRRDWLLPWLPLPAAAALVIWQGHALVRPVPIHALVYVGWAALQQWLVLAILLRRLESRLPQATAVLAAAALFALLHLPNGMLMQLCLLAELAWATCFLRNRALLPVALAHSGCALLAEAGLAGGLLRSLEVSGRFFS